VIRGEVVSVGKGSELKPMTLQKGDIVTYRSAMSVDIGGISYDLIDIPEYLFVERP